MDSSALRRAMALYTGVVLGVAWLAVALLAQFQHDFPLFAVFRDLGFAFWLAFTFLGVALVGTVSWAALTHEDRDEVAEQSAAAAPAPGLDPMRVTKAWDPKDAPTEERTHCARCGRTLPIWRMPEGTCTVCAPYSVFLDKPRKPSPELDRRRNRLFVLQGLGIAMLALAFVSAVYLFPIVLAPERPVLATLGFLVFSPLLFGLILLSYAHSQAVPEPDA